LNTRNLLLAFALAILLAACHSSEGVAEPQPASAGDSLADQAILDLSDRLGIPADEIEVLSDENVTWRDGSLGCPRPDMMYTQALVEGTQIVLRAGGSEYSYHAATGKAPFYCENPVSPAPARSAE
jgi:hypothetical protein